VSASGLELVVERVPSIGPAAIASAIPIARGRTAGPTVDPVEVSIFARFPPAPEKWYQTPAYASAVRSRLKELETHLRVSQRKHDAARGDRDTALLTIAERALVSARSLARNARAPYAPAMDLIAQKQRALESLGSAAEADLAAKRDKAMNLDARLEAAAKELEEAKRAERRAGPSATPDERVTAADHAVGVLRKERVALEAAIRASRAEASPEGEKTRREYEAACHEFAHYVIDDTTNFGPEFDPAREHFAFVDRSFAAIDKEHAVRLAAVSAYDAGAVAKAKLVLAGAIAAALVVVVAIVLAVV
jgi:hypothetical protein